MTVWDSMRAVADHVADEGDDCWLPFADALHLWADAGEFASKTPGQVIYESILALNGGVNRWSTWPASQREVYETAAREVGRHALVWNGTTEAVVVVAPAPWCKKVSYPTRHAARAALADVRQRRVRDGAEKMECAVYRCISGCDSWHLTSQGWQEHADLADHLTINIGDLLQAVAS